MTRPRTSLRPAGQSCRDERGIAMAVAMLVMLVCVILVAAAAALAIHTSQRSALSRNQTASLDAANAGIEAALSSFSNSGACPATGSEVALPDQNLPAESYKIVSCTSGTNPVVAVVGYTPNATNPAWHTTLVAHLNRNVNAPSSGGTAGGYVFPDTLFSTSTVTATGVNTLSEYGLGGTVPDLVANGAINVSGSQIDGLVHGWNTINLGVAAIGGEVVGAGVTLTGATVQGGTSGVVSSGNLTLSGSTVNGLVKYSGTYTSTGSTVTGTVTNGSTTLSNARQAPVYTYNAADIQSALGVGSPTVACPGTGTGNFYYLAVNVSCTYNPASINGTVVLVIAGQVTINVPQTATGGQLYVINENGVLDSVTVNGSSSTLPVFVASDGPVTLNGGITGQIQGAGISTNGPTTLNFSPPVTPPPDFAFNTNQTAPAAAGYAATVSFEYECPGTTAC